MATTVVNGGHQLFKGNAATTAPVALAWPNMLTLQVDTTTALRVRPEGAGADVLFLSQTATDAAYLPKNNPTFTGTFSGPTVNATTSVTINGTTVIDSSRNATFSGLTTATANVTGFGRFQATVGATTTSSIYAKGITPGAANFSALISDDGAYAKLNASGYLNLTIANVAKFTVDTNYVYLETGVGLRVGGVTTIDSSRNGSILSLTVNGAMCIGSDRSADFTSITAGLSTNSNIATFSNGTYGAMIRMACSAASKYAGVSLESVAGLWSVTSRDDAAGGTPVGAFAVGDNSAIRLWLTSSEMNLPTCALKMGAVTVIDSSRNATFSGLTTPSATISDFGVLREVPGATSVGAIYPTGVVAGATTHAFKFADDGSYIGVNASGYLNLTIANVAKFTVDTNYVYLETGVGLRVGGVTTIDSSRNATFATLTAGATTLSEFGTITSLVGDSTYGAIYPTGATPSATNYTIRFADNNSSITLNAATTAEFAIANTIKLQITSTGVALNTGVSLTIGGATVVDSSRNASFVGLSLAGTLALTKKTTRAATTFTATLSDSATSDRTNLTNTASVLILTRGSTTQYRNYNTPPIVDGEEMIVHFGASASTRAPNLLVYEAGGYIYDRNGTEVGSNASPLQSSGSRRYLAIGTNWFEV